MRAPPNMLRLGFALQRQGLDANYSLNTHPSVWAPAAPHIIKCLSRSEERRLCSLPGGAFWVTALAGLTLGLLQVSGKRRWVAPCSEDLLVFTLVHFALH